MLYYELLCILPGTLSEEEAAALLESVTKMAVEAGAVNLKTESMGKNRLAYPMKHIRYGYFYVVRFEAEAAQVGGIQNKLRLSTQLLRALIQAYNPAKHKDARIRSFIAAEGFVPTGGSAGADRSAGAGGYVRRDRPFGSARPAAAGRPAPAPDQSMPLLEAVPVAKAPKDTKPKEQVSLEDIDKQLDKILEADIEV